MFLESSLSFCPRKRCFPIPFTTSFALFSPFRTFWCHLISSWVYRLSPTAHLLSLRVSLLLTRSEKENWWHHHPLVRERKNQSCEHVWWWREKENSFLSSDSLFPSFFLWQNERVRETEPTIDSRRKTTLTTEARLMFFLTFLDGVFFPLSWHVSSRQVAMNMNIYWIVCVCHVTRLLVTLLFHPFRLLPSIMFGVCWMCLNHLIWKEIISFL